MPIYAIGDIHGSLRALKTIFKQGIIQTDDKVVFLGDYIDRGPDSKGVIDWLINNQKNHDFEFILGNHEIMMKAAKMSPVRLKEWLHFGGANTLESYHINNTENWMDIISPSHWDFIDSCLDYLEIKDFIFIHAGLEAGKNLNEQNKHHLFWKKYENPKAYNSTKTVICGHTSRKNGEIADFKHTICIDTYAHGGMWLTCLNVETGEFIKANNKGKIRKGTLKRYANIK
ncbi:metallophosphoesterase family protein [Aureibacter tunicatorum]|uniref:Serine/threonine protein phosphatase 1 n=1 Tax=Aureibacter tunicatorum TaxID=866807 RepID=A0AAE3XN40_9BACT|nr:metallophosphoesterase family protein [Aureibacter tunicatorum]MDR6239512.1 serine/threonine protein phosphatase 1 [Aureibacter tunicatorum]BDD03989.1 serine/threonine protein phosphatase [Aureibacter tunicatorum]